MPWTAVLLRLAILPTASQGTVIDFDAKAAAVGPLVERLASQTGAHIRASAKIAHEVVYVHAKGVTLQELKARLAQSLLAQWTRDGDTEYLTRSPAQERRIWTDHLAYRRKLVDQALENARKQLEKPFDAAALARGLAALAGEDETREDRAAATRRYYAEKALFARGPLTRLTNRLILASNRDDLAAVGPFERRIFRLDPTPMQRGFDRKKYAAAIAAFGAEQRAWQDEAAKVTFPPEPRGRMASDPRAQLSIEPKISGLSVELRRGEMSSLFLANLTGEKVEPFGFGVLTQVMFADPVRNFLDSLIAPKAPDAEDPIVELSDDSKELQQRMVEAFAARQPNPLTPKMRELMLGIEENDPLSWTVSDGLSAIARMKKVNLIAAVPYAAMSMAALVSRDKPMRARQFLDALIGSGTLELLESDGWAVMSPPDRYEAAIDFTPRSAAAALVSSVLAAGRLDIRDYAAYAFQSKRLNRGGFGDIFVAMIDRSVLGASDRTDWKTLQLFGSLGKAQQRTLEAGGRILYSGLNAAQAGIVDRIVYGARLTSGTIAPNGATTFSGAGVEPTDAFPARVPPDCGITAIVQNNPVIVAYGKGSDGKTRPLRGLDPWNLAAIETDVVGDPARMASYGVTNLVGYAPGMDRVLQIRVEPAAGVWAPSTITVPEYDPDAAPVPWEKLPDPYPKQITAALAQQKAQKANQPGRAIPPR